MSNRDDETRGQVDDRRAGRGDRLASPTDTGPGSAPALPAQKRGAGSHKSVVAAVATVSGGSRNRIHGHPLRNGNSGLDSDLGERFMSNTEHDIAQPFGLDIGTSRNVMAREARKKNYHESQFK